MKTTFPIKITVITLLVIIIAGGVVLLALPAFIDAAKIEAAIAEQVKAATGRELVIKGAPSKGIFPAPYVQFPALELRYPETPETAEEVRAVRFQAGGLRLQLGWSSLFSEHPLPQGLLLQSPSLDIPTGSADTSSAWKEVLAPLLLYFTPASSTLPAITVENGLVIVRSPETDSIQRAEGIYATLRAGSAQGAAQLHGRAALPMAEVTFQASIGTDTEGPVDINIATNHGGTLLFKGTRGSADVPDELTGTLQTSITDVKALLQKTGAVPAPTAAEPQSVLPGQQAAPVATTAEALPVSVEGKAHIGLEGIRLEETNLTLGADQGTIDAQLNWLTAPLALTARLKMKELHLNPLLGMLSVNATPEGKITFNETPQNPFPEHISIVLDATADTLLLGERKYANASFFGEMAEGTLTVNQLKMEMPEGGALTVFGVAAPQLKGLRFDGNMEIVGDNLKRTLTFFDRAAERLPDEGFGAYSAQATLFISSDQVRLSEATLKIGDLTLAGGVVMYFEATPRLEAEMRFKDTNLDFFRDIWRSAKQKDTKAEFTFMRPGTAEFDWLRRLDSVIDLRISFDGFTFLEHQGQTGGFRLYARRNELRFAGLRFYYPEGNLDANILLSVAGERPHVDVVTSLPFLDMGYFTGSEPEAEQPVQAPETTHSRWSERLFDFGWMGDFTGAFDVSVADLRYGERDLDNFKLKAQLQSQTLNVQNLSMQQDDGTLDASGSLSGGKVPGLSASFTLYNMDIARLFENFAGLQDLSGRFSASGSFVTSGIHLLAWVKQAEGKMVLTGRGVRVNHFDLDGVVRTVQSARSTPDVVTGISSNLAAGRTEFSVDGNLNLAGGMFRTPGVTLKSGSTIGNLSGEIALLPWTLDLSALFQFPQLSTETVPTLQVQISGPIGSHTLKTDTASLEAFVAKKVVGQ